MAVDTRKKNIKWVVADDRGVTASYDMAHLAVLMDIRDELQGIIDAIHTMTNRNLTELRGLRRDLKIAKKRHLK